MLKNENKANVLNEEDLGNISGGTSFLEASSEDQQAYMDHLKGCYAARERGANLAIPSFESWEKYHKKRNTSQK